VGQKLMLDAFMLKIFFYLSVVELGFIVTPYLLDLSMKLIMISLQEFLEHLLCFSFIMQKEYPTCLPA
jgi:hypothetical protein